MRYRVDSRVFNSLPEAVAYASAIFDLTGVVVAIEAA